MAGGRRATRTVATALLSAAFVACVALFVGLGVWQLERRVWKHALIERVEARLGAAPVAPPPIERWPTIGAASDEYRRLRLGGHWIGGTAVRIKAVTRLGPGCWVLAPLRLADGSAVLVNRGFLGDEPMAEPPAAVDASARSAAPAASVASVAHAASAASAASAAVVAPLMPSPCAAATPPPTVDSRDAVDLVGLLRLSEPDGGFLRRNDPVARRWFSRDVAGIAAAMRVGVPVAPYFVDAEATPIGTARPGEPIGGLTVVAFRDDHLVYALTWFALALLSAFAVWRLLRGAGRDRADELAGGLTGDGETNRRSS